MALGTIKSFDEDSQKGYIQPESGGDDVPFELKDVEDYHEGDMITTGDKVTYHVEGGLAGTAATQVRRLAPRGYE